MPIYNISFWIRFYNGDEEIEASSPEEARDRLLELDILDLIDGMDVHVEIEDVQELQEEEHGNLEM